MIVPNGTLIMVVDGAELSIYRNDSKALQPELTLIDNIVHHAPPTAELGSDRPGRRFERMGTSRGAYEGPDYHQKEEDRFALEAAQRLELLADQDEQRLILVAAPRVLGVIRAHISPTTQQSTLSMIAKDYTDRDPRDIAEMLVRHAN